MNRVAVTIAALLAGLALPASASAAERFVGVLENGRLVTFTDPFAYALTTPLAPRGLAQGERLVALSSGPRGTVGVGSSAQLYAVDAVRARVTRIGAPFAQGLRGARFSLAVAPGGATARLISDVGQDLTIDLATGAAAEGPGLRRADDGTPVRPAVAYRPDGRLMGVTISPLTLFTESAPGASAFAATALPAPTGLRLGEPIDLALGTNGRGYVLAVLSDRQRTRQSVLVRFDPATGRPFPSARRSGEFLSRRIDSFTSIGTVPADRTAPRISARLPRTVSARRVLARRLPVVLRCTEACQVTVSLRIGGQRAGFGFASRDTPGTVSVPNFFVQGAERARVRAGVGSQARLVIGVSDFKRNRRSITRTVRLER